MQKGSFTLDSEVNDTNCTFCQHSSLNRYLLKATPTFLVITDHAPLVEGHLLIIPKYHYACYGDVPAELDAELFALKREVQQFLAYYYAPVIFWEHGIFRQTVFHAHLHCFPFGPIEYDLSQGLHAAVVHSQEDIRAWYSKRGHYFYMENAQQAFLFAPEMERYLPIIQGITHAVIARSGQRSWRSSQQRQEMGAPLIEATVARWRLFQQQGA